MAKRKDRTDESDGSSNKRQKVHHSESKTSASKKKLSSKAVTSDSKTPRVKSSKKLDRLEEARKAYKWWEAPKLGSGINWQYLEHPGISFPPDYIPHKIPLIYGGKEIVLNPEEEEIASFFAAMPLDGPQLGNDKTRPVFQKNFFDDFKEILGPSHEIKEFSKCDFSLIRDYLQIQKNLKKVATDEEKQNRKNDKEVSSLKFGYALIDGRVEKVTNCPPYFMIINFSLISYQQMGNFNMEPPGLFRGRGEHPKTGKLKTRCFPESVSLNISEDACVPICPLNGHSWQSVRHDPTVTWLCGWTENVQKQNKYVMLAASSSFKGKSDMDKYSKAIKLKSCIQMVRNDYTAKIRQTKVRTKDCIFRPSLS